MSQTSGHTDAHRVCNLEHKKRTTTNKLQNDSFSPFGYMYLLFRGRPSEGTDKLALYNTHGRAPKPDKGRLRGLLPMMVQPRGIAHFSPLAPAKTDLTLVRLHSLLLLSFTIAYALSYSREVASAPCLRTAGRPFFVKMEAAH